MKFWLIIFFNVFTFCNTKAQQSCPISSYKTSSVGESKDSVAFKLPLNFIITADSIVSSIDSKGRKPFLAFRILSKECKWNESFTEGKTTYKVMMHNIPDNKFPTVVIDFEDKTNKYIAVFYENGMKRFFSIANENL